MLVFTKNIMSAAAWLHGQRVVHLDLKTRNMLLMSHGRLVLCDFGCAARLDDLPSQANWGTNGFRCPERIPGVAADLFSIGKVLEFMWNESEDFKAPALVHEAIAGCLQEEASQRPPLQDTLSKMKDVQDRRKMYMSWPAELRLRKAGWYSYQVAFKEADIAYQQWFKVLRSQVQQKCGSEEERVGEAEWCD